MKFKQPINNVRGFTLIELMIVVAILGIIATIAIPEYSKFVRESRRADAIASMNRMMAQSELYYANNNSAYTTNVTLLGFTQRGTINNTFSADRYYNIAVSDCANGIPATASCIILTATPIAGTTQAQDTPCQTFRLTSQDRKTAMDGSSVDRTAECWS